MSSPRQFGWIRRRQMDDRTIGSTPPPPVQDRSKTRRRPTQRERKDTHGGLSRMRRLSTSVAGFLFASTALTSAAVAQDAPIDVTPDAMAEEAAIEAGPDIIVT